MIGVPMLAHTIAKLAFAKKLTLPGLLGGVFLQWMGHYVFERNQPTLLETHDLTSIPAAVVFACEQWLDVLRGRWIKKNGLNLWQKH